MNTKIRLVAALVVCAAVFIAGIGAPAWADRLKRGARAPAATGPQFPLQAESRPQGTVIITEPVVTLSSDVLATVASCATVLLKPAPEGVVYTASVVVVESLPLELPGSLMSCIIQIEAAPATEMGAEVEVCFPIPPGATAFAYQHDGTEWVQTATEVNDAQSCVTIPATAGPISFTGLFSTYLP